MRLIYTLFPTARCERCHRGYQKTQPHRRYCSRTCQMNAYFAKRLREDPAFHQRALEYQRSWRRKQATGT